MIINSAFHMNNETFAWIVTQILAAETAKQQARNDAPPKKEQPHV